MSPSSVTALAWLAGITFPAYVIWNVHPSRRRMVLAFVAWLLIWAALMDEPTEERGPWMLALIPLVLVGAMFAFRPAGAGATVHSGLAILAGVIVAYLSGVLAYRHLRRS